MSSTPARMRFINQKEAWKKRDFMTVKNLAEEAQKQLEQKGFVRAEPAFGWIEKEWLQRALKEGAVKKTSKGYIPAAYEVTEKRVIGHRGREPIYEAKNMLDTSQWQSFCQRYEQYRASKINEENEKSEV